jgi:UDP-N-acetylmuramoyl-tripeptide--D-alanyl-D-alanine ligase
MSALLWSAEELSALFGAPSATFAGGATGVSIDSRSLKPGDLFVAIKGDALDGHAFVERAFAAGAAAAICEISRVAELGQFGPVYAVDDTLRAMERLGVAARARSGARIAAVTGSVGKTSAKEMLRLALSASGDTHASAASFNNHWGVPLTLCRLRREAAFAVFEIGMNHAGEITPLVGFVRPHVALVTTIAPVHIEYLGSIEAIADAKAEIFSGVVPGGVAVVNRDAPQAERLIAAAEAGELEVRAFGSGESYARLLSREPVESGSRLRISLGEREFAFTLGAPGAHMAENAVGVLAVVEALGADVDAAAKALEHFAPQKGRGERFTLPLPEGALTVIDESYNANPVSMRAALELLCAATPGPGGRRVAVIGDMLELGAESAALHAALAPDLETRRVDLLFAAGSLSRALYDAVPASRRAHWAEHAEALQAPLFAALRAGDVVMIKASNGSRMGPLVAALRARFATHEKRDD